MVYRYAWLIFLFSFLNSGIIYGYIPYKQTDATFDTKVRKYLSVIKDKLLDVPNGSNILETSHTVIDPKKLATLMNAVQEIDVSGLDISADQIRVAVLIQVTVPIIEKFRQDLLKTITQLEASKQYWEFYRDHPAFYESLPFVERFSRQKKADFNTKINTLDIYLDNQYTNLGSLVIQLDEFDEQKSPDDHYAWVQQLSTIIISAYPGNHITPDIVTSDIALKLIVKMQKCVTHYAPTILAQVRPYLAPNFFKLHWLKIVGATVAMSYGSHYAYAKKELLQQRTQQGYSNIARYTKDQYNRVYNAFFQVEKEDSLKQEEQLLMKDYEDCLTKIYKRIVGSTENINRGSMKEELKNTESYVVHDLINDVDPNKRIQFNPIVIHQKATGSLEDAISYLDDVVSPLLLELLSKEGGKASGALGMNKGADNNAPQNLGIWNQAKNLIGTGYQMTQELHKFGQTSDTGFTSLPLVYLKIRCEQARWKQRLFDIEKSSRIPVALMSSILAGIVLWFGSKALYAIYKKIRSVKVYDSLRNALVDVGTILNAYGEACPTAMLRADYGRLLYLIYRLADEARNVPRNFRTAFMHDVKLLQSSTLSAAQKLRHIDLIYKRYPFLSNDERLVRSVSCA